MDSICCGKFLLSTLSFCNAIARNGLLPVGAKAADRAVAQSAVFCFSPMYPGAPFLPVAQGHFTFHQLYDLGFTQAKLKADSFKRRAVFPGHFHDAIDGGIRQLVFEIQFFHVFSGAAIRVAKIQPPKQRIFSVCCPPGAKGYFTHPDDLKIPLSATQRRRLPVRRGNSGRRIASSRQQ